MKRIGLALACAASTIACSSTPTVIPTKNMDEPTDMAFVCLQLQDGVLSGAPMSKCHSRGALDPSTTVNGQRVLGTFAFIPNATRGELAVADMDRGRLLDLAPASPGYGMFPIGGDPESVTASQDGCWVATANRTTCDFSLIDPSRMLVLADTFDSAGAPAVPVTGAGDSAHRITTIQTGSTHRQLHSTTGEIAFLLPEGAHDTCQDVPPPRAVATFPGCDMVAVLDLSFETGTATIRSAYYVRSGGFESAGDEPVCPINCAASSTLDAERGLDGGASSPDGGVVADGGGQSEVPVLATPGTTQVQPLVLEPDGSRVHVGGLVDTGVTSFGIAAGALVTPSRFELAGKPAGVSRLRLSVDPYATPAEGTVAQGKFLDDSHKFLYAVANDDSIHVVEITGATPVECDVNVIPSADTSGQACIPVGTGRRRALARGPGLQVPTFSNPDLPPPLPRDITFASLIPASSSNPQSLSGQFGFLLAANGQVYPVDTATHSFREYRDNGQAQATALLLSITPQRSVVVSDQAFASTPNFGSGQGPMVESFTSDSVAGSWFGFPDPSGLISRSWNIVWEGVLPDTSRESGVVNRPGTVSSVGSAGSLNDAGANFCSSGVRPGDVLMFAGCVLDSDCQPDNLFSCQVPISGARGLCLPKNGAQRDELTGRADCARFMGSRLRYEVAEAGPSSLALNLKLDEVPKTTLNPCTADSDCSALNTGSQHVFQCLELRPQAPRCVEKCVVDTDCRPGNVCEQVPGLAPPFTDQKLCVQAPPLVPDCFPQPMTRYSVRAGNSYVVFGSSLPRVRDRKTSADGKTCEVVDPGNPELVNRIPLAAPKCPDLVQSTSPVTALSAFSLPPGSNPCLYTAPKQEGSTAAPPIRAFFENPQIRFALGNLEQYAGDLLTIHFEFQYGFQPLQVPAPNYEILLTMPIRIFTGPTMTPESPVRRNPPTAITYPYVYVMDQGRTALTPGSRGQVLRINPREGSSEIASFDTAISGSTPFQLQ